MMYEHDSMLANRPIPETTNAARSLACAIILITGRPVSSDISEDLAMTCHTLATFVNRLC